MHLLYFTFTFILCLKTKYIVQSYLFSLQPMVCVRQDVAAGMVIVQTSPIISVSTTRASALLNQALTTVVSANFLCKT